MLGGGKGTKIYKGEGTNDLYLTMSEAPSAEIAVLLVNSSDEEKEFEISFEKEIGKTLKRYVVDPRYVEQSAGVPEMEKFTETEVTDKIIDKLPAGAVVAYTNK